MIYSYECPECEQDHDARVSVAKRDEPRECPHCGHSETRRITVYEPRFNLPGDDWPSKNEAVVGQMAEKNRRLQAKEEQMKRDSPAVKLAPNVGGERVDSWGEAQRLAASKGLNAESYEPMIKKEAELKKTPTVG